MPLHVAVDARFAVLDDRGIGRYARAVLPLLAAAPDTRWTFVVPGAFAAGRRRAVAAALGVDPATIAREVPRDAAVIFNPSNGSALRSEAPQVTMVHDAAPFAFPAANVRTRRREQEPFLRTARLARRIIVQSSFTAREVTQLLGVPAERLSIVPLGVDAVFTPGRAEAMHGQRYILNVGAHDERKNTATLIAGYEAAFPRRDVALVFTRLPARLPEGGVVAGARGDAELLALYRGAALVAVPSTYEGFGLPLLEALACGVPALAARAGALPEVGGEACAYVDAPHDPAAWGAALRRLLGDDGARAALAAAGPQRAAEFSWQRCADATLAVLREATR